MTVRRRARLAASLAGRYTDAVVPLNHLATGLATDRVPEDDVILVAVHFTKDNGELSSITLDEHTQVEVLS